MAISKVQSKQLRRLIASSGLFDPRWYSKRYPGVPEEPKRALDDFIQFGLPLGRDPGPDFSVSDYLERRPEAASEPLGALVYFLGSPSDADRDPDIPGREGLYAEFLSQGIRIGIDHAVVEDFRLTVGGWVLDPLKPGLVHRVELWAGGTPVGTALAREPSGGVRPARAPGDAAIFSATFPLAERFVGSPVALRVVGTEAEILLRPLVLAPALEVPRDTGSAAASVERDDRIVGRVGAATTSQVAGWALCERTRSAEGVELLLLVDGRPLAVARCVHARSDAAEKYGARGPIGFRFHLPLNVWTGEPLRFEVVPTVGVNAIQNHAGVLSPPAGLWVPASPKAPSPAKPVAPPEPVPAPKISVIILNRNGCGILRDLLVSAQRSGDIDRAEWIVIDHQSTDDSEAICRGFKAAGHAVEFIPRNGNFSFSASNNYGVRHARGDILVFANNDLVFVRPVMEQLAARLQDPAIGILGAELLDHVAAPGCQDRLPVQHDGVFLKPSSEGPYLRPFEARSCPDIDDGAPWGARPAVTAAFVAMRRADFEGVGGFDEGYEYGLEDIDLCFRVIDGLGKTAAIDRELKIIHRHGFSREADPAMRARRVRNNEHFNARWGRWLRRTVRSEALSRRAFWFGRRPVVAFTVTNTKDAGDYLTALELGRAIQRAEAVHVVYLGRDDWKDFTGVDLLINMSPYFDLDKAEAINPFILTVNWIRQWFDRWSEQRSLASFDLTLASSDDASRYLAERTAVTAEVMPIATDFATMASGARNSAYECDYCFTGGFFGVKREIEFDLDPAAIRGRGRIFGTGWETTSLSAMAFGALPYDEMPNVYASTRIVIDDGVFATARWGSCNSRVFDALAAGCLVVTNNQIGARELFGDLMPVYQGREELTRVLNYWLEHDAEREARVDQLRQIVRDRHDYRNRAQQVLGLLAKPARRRIAIKCPAPLKDPNAWGDYHFAQSLARCLRRGGATVRIDLREEWENAIADADEVVIALRGVLPYKPRANQLNILWLISHPDKVPSSEIDGYDHVYVASEIDARRLAERAGTSVSFLPQCTDTDRFTFDPAAIGTRDDRILFVGNSRAIFRDSVRWSIEHDLDVHVFGQGWEPFIKDSRLKGLNVPNEVLGELYGSSRMVLCDHWADMARMGYVSNRAFDVLAVGGRLVTDHVEGMETLLPEGAYDVFRSGEELARIAATPATVAIEDRRKWSDWVREHHSFEARAKEILRLIDERS